METELNELLMRASGALQACRWIRHEVGAYRDRRQVVLASAQAVADWLQRQEEAMTVEAAGGLKATSEDPA